MASRGEAAAPSEAPRAVVPYAGAKALVAFAAADTAAARARVWDATDDGGRVRLVEGIEWEGLPDKLSVWADRLGDPALLRLLQSRDSFPDDILARVLAPGRTPRDTDDSAVYVVQHTDADRAWALNYAAEQAIAANRADLVRRLLELSQGVAGFRAQSMMLRAARADFATFCAVHTDPRTVVTPEEFTLAVAEGSLDAARLMRDAFGPSVVKKPARVFATACMRGAADIADWVRAEFGDAITPTVLLSTMQELARANVYDGLVYLLALDGAEAVFDHSVLCEAVQRNRGRAVRAFLESAVFAALSAAEGPGRSGPRDSLWASIDVALYGNYRATIRAVLESGYAKASILAWRAMRDHNNDAHAFITRWAKENAPGE